MKTLLLLLSLTLIASSCKKYVPDTPTYCWECDFDGTGLKDAGCMTVDQFKNKVYTDGQGNIESKSSCKMKH